MVWSDIICSLSDNDRLLLTEIKTIINDYGDIDITLVSILDEITMTTNDEKQHNAEVSSPTELLDIMIENLSDEYIKTDKPTLLDYSCGKGNIVICAFMKYYNALSQLSELSVSDICKIICEDCLFIADINPINVYITLYKLQCLCDLVTKSSTNYNYKYRVGDSFDLNIKDQWDLDGIDIVFVNPPFENKLTKNKTQHKLWIDFTLKTFEKWLKKDGYLYQISPSSFVSPSSKIFTLFKQKKVEKLQLHQEKYFPTVNSSISWYIIQNTDDNTYHTLINDNTQLLINDTLLYLPNDFNLTSLSIHKKVMFDTLDKLTIQYDYVTCHNNIILKSKRNNVHSSLSREKTETHIYPVFHTNKQIWWSEIKQDLANKKKVMWTRSGYTKPFYDNGLYGVTDLAYYVLVDDDEEGINLNSVLNSPLFTYIFKTAKWSGFGNEKVFNAIPKLPNKKYTDIELYTYFNLTNEEIQYITNIS
jgi:hypothetical protein